MRSMSAQRYVMACFSLVSRLYVCSTLSSVLNCRAAFFWVSCGAVGQQRGRRGGGVSPGGASKSGSAQPSAGRAADGVRAAGGPGSGQPSCLPCFRGWDAHRERAADHNGHAGGSLEPQLDLCLDLRLARHLRVRVPWVHSSSSLTGWRGGLAGGAGQAGP